MELLKCHFELLCVRKCSCFRVLKESHQDSKPPLSVLHIWPEETQLMSPEAAESAEEGSHDEAGIQFIEH